MSRTVDRIQLPTSLAFSNFEKKLDKSCCRSVCCNASVIPSYWKCMYSEQINLRCTPQGCQRLKKNKLTNNSSFNFLCVGLMNCRIYPNVFSVVQTKLPQTVSSLLNLKENYMSCNHCTAPNLCLMLELWIFILRSLCYSTQVAVSSSTSFTLDSIKNDVMQIYKDILISPLCHTKTRVVLATWYTESIKRQRSLPSLCVTSFMNLPYQQSATPNYLVVFKAPTSLITCWCKPVILFYGHITLLPCSFDIFKAISLNLKFSIFPESYSPSPTEVFDKQLCL